MMLGDFGAHVIKVERPGVGDESRGWGPPFDSRGESAYYLSCNRNKLGIALDLQEATDRTLLTELIRSADVVLDNYKRGTLERHALVPEEFLAEQPSLVWCTLTGFGPDSPRLGYDFVVQGEAGWMSITGEPNGAPMKTGVAFADVIAGKDAAVAILAALLAVRRGPVAVEGRRLFVSLFHSATAALVNVAQNTLVSGSPPRRWGNAHANLVPYQLFDTADRPIVIAVGNDQQWRACCAALGAHDLAAAPDLASNAGRLAHRDRVVAALAGVLAVTAASDAIAALDARGVPCGVVRSVPEALADVSHSPTTGISPRPPAGVRLPPPRLDEHGGLIRTHRWDAFAHL